VNVQVPSPPGAGSRRSGMRGFTIVWLGQVISLLGTGMTRFAIIFWAWQISGRAMATALVAFFSFAPTVLISPLAGALVDRWNRKLVMMLSDIVAGLTSLALLVLVVSGRLQIWHLYLAGAFAGVFESFQVPAYGAALSTMLPKRHYARASGMMSMAQSGAEIGAPLLAGILLRLLGMAGILAIDVATFAVAVAALAMVHVPQPSRGEAGADSARTGLWQESLFGFRYIFERAGLLGLQLVFFADNLLAAMAFNLLPAMVLARTANDTVALGTVQAALGIGGLAGGLALSAWGGPKRRLHGILLGWALSMVGQVAFGLGRGVAGWAVAGAVMMFFTPILNGSNQAIWQSKVAPELQGRVFGARRLIAQVSWPLATLAGGFLADHVLEPGMQAGGSLARLFGALVGTGSGAGMALLFALTGGAGVGVSLLAYSFRATREIEVRLPDHDALPAEA
jgi:DHA3 family macrolide efflux protein-like MFS transporter